MAYQENPVPRSTAQTTDGYVLSYFEWRNSPMDTWAKEVQYVEPCPVSPEFPNGIQVWWRPYVDTTDFTSQTLEQFKNSTAGFPKKPGTRGGSPQG